MWSRSDPEAKVNRRDAGALYDALGARYLSPTHGFDELAPTYDQRLAGNPVLLLESAVMLAALPDLRDRTVADIGCGTGRYALQLARSGARSVVGVDLSPVMLEMATRKAARAEDLSDVLTWRRGDLLERLPLGDASMEVVLCALTLSFLSETGGALRELARVLAPGGALIVSDYHPHGLAQARAAGTATNGNKEKAPFLRFTSAAGDDCRIAQYVHTVSDLYQSAGAAGLTLRHLAEPIADRHTTNTYAGLRDQAGVPLALVARFEKA